MKDFQLQCQEEKLTDSLSVMVARIQGNIDAMTVRRFEDEMLALFELKTKLFILDLSELKFINSTGMGMLVKIADKFQLSGKEITLVSIPMKVQALLDMLGLGSFFQTCSTKQEAMQIFADKYSAVGKKRPIASYRPTTTPPTLTKHEVTPHRGQIEIVQESKLDKDGAQKAKKKRRRSTIEPETPPFGAISLGRKEKSIAPPPPPPPPLAPPPLDAAGSASLPPARPAPQPAPVQSAPPPPPCPAPQSAPAQAAPPSAPSPTPAMKPAKLESALGKTQRSPGSGLIGGAATPPMRTQKPSISIGDQETLKRDMEIDSKQSDHLTIDSAKIPESDMKGTDVLAVRQDSKPVTAISKTRARDDEAENIPLGSMAEETSVEAESELRRKATVRYFKQMYPFCSFPLTVLFSQKKIRQLVHQIVAQVESDRDVVVTAASPCVEIVPQLPGCIVIPERKKLDITPEVSSGSFEVTPLAEGYFPRASIEVYYQDQLLDTILIPTRVTKQTIAKFAVYAGIASPVISTIMDTFRVDLKQQLPVVVVWLSTLVNALGGPTMFGILLAGVFAVLALVFYWFKRPQQADPVEAMLAIN